MHALIRAWTGTGNTARAVAVAAGTLEAEGWTVDRAIVRFDTPVPTVAEVEAADLVVIACPALGLSTASHFLRWLDRWPLISGGAAAVLGIVGAEWVKGAVVPGWSGALLGEVSSRLRRRGLSVVAASDVSYPVNWTQMLAPLAPEIAQRINEAADASVRDRIRSLVVPGLPGTLPALPLSRGWGRRTSSLMSGLFRLIARRFLGKVFVADASCTACGLCARTCPAGAIVLRGGRPSWNLDCDACNRCINLCPPASIQVSLARIVLHGGGNLALTAWGIALVVAGQVAEGLAVYGFGTVLQLTAVDALLGRLEAVPGLNPVLAWGWTKKWGRYRAPGFRG